MLIMGQNASVCTEQSLRGAIREECASSACAENLPKCYSSQLNLQSRQIVLQAPQTTVSSRVEQ